ncbi:MAG: prolipoprotein diacylglyceryl transferase [Anaerolineales bacterium]
MPVGFEIAGFVIPYYGIILISGALLGAFLAVHEARRRGHDPDIVWDLFIWLLIAGIIGARLWHVFTPSPSAIAAGRTTLFYLTHPLDLINIRSGGLGIPGAVIGGAVAMFFFARKHGLRFSEWADISAPSLALGQAIGRWGNYVNQELYGAPTDLPWKIFIDPGHRLPGFEAFEYYHPLFLYESLWNLGNMFLLIWLTRRYASRLKDGDIFLVYLIVYPVGRFLLDFLRLDAAMVGGINANQSVMAVVALLSVLALVWRHRADRRPAV